MINKEDAMEAVKELSELGYKVGHTSAMSYVAAKKVAEAAKNKNILIIFYDSANRY